MKNRAALMTEVDKPGWETALPSRRTFLTLTAAAVALAATVDHVATQDHWPATATTMFEIPNLTSRPNYDAWLAVPGYGSIHGKIIAQQIRRNPGIPKNAPIGAFVYGNEVVEMNQLAKLTGAFVRRNRLAQNAGTLSLYGHSMGGVIGFNVAHRAGLPLRDVILNGSPFDIDDARMGAAKAAATISDATGYHGSIASKYIGAIWKRFENEGCDGLRAFMDRFGEAGRDTWSGASPLCMGSQLCILDEYPVDGADYTGILVPGYTRVAYCMPRDIEGDQTVFDVQAADKYEQLLHKYDIPLHRIHLPVPQHADTLDAMHHTAPFLDGRYLNDDTAA